MKTRVTPREIDGLSEVSARFPAVLCDVWGVVHDGVLPLQSGVDALVAYRNNGGVVMLISNAPRPSWSVREQMVEIGVNVSCFDGLITSGDVTRSYLQEQKGARVFHLGPDRDYSIYEGLSVETSGLDSADVVCCSGLFDRTARAIRPHAGADEGAGPSHGLRQSGHCRRERRSTDPVCRRIGGTI